MLFSALAATISLPARELSPTTCFALLAIAGVVLNVWVLLLARVYGRPPDWPTAWRVAVVLGAMFGIVGWWWINKPVEGETLFTVSTLHGITAGDLLALPMVALMVVVALPGRSPRVPASRRGSPNEERPRR